MRAARILFIVAAVGAIAGCATVREQVIKASAANDAALKSAEFMLCRGASVGSIRRAFGSPERAELWRRLCAEGSDFSPEQAP